MRNISLLIVGFSCLLFSLQSCHKKDECQCRSLEDCIDGTCVLQENAYYINNQGIKGTYLYHGVVKGNTCVIR